MSRGPNLVRLVLPIAIVVAIAGCGGGGSSTAKSTGSDPSSSAAGSEFVRPGGQNKIATFGQEAPATERDAASAVLTRSLRTREVGEWAAQCATLTPLLAKEIEESTPTSGRESCAKSLRVEAEPLAGSSAIRADTLKGPISALRVEGSRGYALYHGTDGNDYAVPMRKVDGAWKVDSLQTKKIY